MKHFLFTIVFFMSFTLYAQERTVSGTVTASEDGSTLPGVNVVIKGTTTGVATDVNGKYTISVSETDVLVFSQVGMTTQEVTVGTRTVIDIAMTVDTDVLEEVVVTALGVQQQKRSLGYSIQQVKGESIAETQRPNFMVSLQGRVAGLNMTTTSGLPGSSTSITLRGIASITGDNQPLIVVDGLPIDNRTINEHHLVTNGNNTNNDYINRAADINPNDIESVSILKGPEAAALYGQDGASGAIIITTKKGAEGSAKITYDNNFGFQKVNRFPQTQKVYSRGNVGSIPDPDNPDFNYFGAKYSDGETMYDNLNSFFQTGSNQNHNLVVEGGGPTMTNRLSLNYYNTNGIVPENTYDKLSARLTSSIKVLEKLTATTTINYVQSNDSKPFRGPGGYLLELLKWPANDDISVYLNPDGSRRRLIPDTNTEAFREPNNPFYSVYTNSNTSSTNRVISNLSLSYDALSWLNFSGRLAADIYSTTGNIFISPYSDGQIVAGAGGLEYIGSVQNYYGNNRYLNGQFLTTAKKEFGDIKTTLMVGTSFDDRNVSLRPTTH